MKTILVLTDFSIKADHAAQYALKLAQKIEANLLICNVYPETPLAKSNRSTGYGSDTFEDASKEDLAELAGRLNRRLDQADSNCFRPLIEQCSKPGQLVKVINYIAASRPILFAVIATHNSDDILAFLNGNHAHEIIEQSDCPVLIVPEHALFFDFQKIAIAADFRSDSTAILANLGQINKYFNAELLIAHVGKVKLGNVFENTITKRFLSCDIQAPHKPKICYKAIYNKNITEGLCNLAQEPGVDLLVLIHRKRNWLRKIIGPSVAKKLADRSVKPLLVFPENYERRSFLAPHSIVNFKTTTQY